VTSEIADFRPKTIWLGTTVPGKKMMAILIPKWGLQRGRSLIDLYKNRPFDAIIAVSFALDAIPQEGAKFGPALRDLFKEQSPEIIYGAILTDIRDFLKLRFRAKGLAETEEAARAKLEEVTGTKGIQAAIENGDPEIVVGYVVNYVITALDTLSRSQALGIGGSYESRESSLFRLRDMLKSTARWLDSQGQDHFDQYVAPLFRWSAEGKE